MITALSFLDVFENYDAFKDFTDVIGLYPVTDTVSEAFNQSIYWNIVNRYGDTDVNYYEDEPFKAEFTIAYEQYFKQFLSKKKIVDATNGITLDDYQIISESLSNFSNNPNKLRTDPWELLTYTSQQQRGRAKAGKLTAYINALRQMPDAQIDAFLDKIDYMWSNLLSDSHACGEDIDGTVVYVRGQYQRKWSPDSIIDNVELINEDVEDLKVSKQDALTPAQQSAVNSGIDSTKVAQIQTNADNIIILQAIKYGASLQATIDTSTYVMTLQLKDQDGNNLGTAQTIDLPLESVVVDGRYDGVNEALVLVLKNGNTISIPIGALINGLVTTDTAQTITGKKTIKAEMEWETSASGGGSSKLSIKNDNGYNAKIKMGSTENMRLMTGGTYFGATVAPISDNATDLGASNTRWKDLYLKGKLNLDNYVIDKDNFGQLQISNANTTSMQFDGDYIRAKNLVPIGNNSRDLGSSGAKWKDLYLSGKLSDGTNEVNINEIAKISDIPAPYTLPQATNNALGGIKADPKTSSDTQEVKIDTSTGKLYTQAGGSPINVIDNLNSTSTTDALSANQGKQLNDTKLNKQNGSVVLYGNASNGNPTTYDIQLYGNQPSAIMRTNSDGSGVIGDPSNIVDPTNIVNVRYGRNNFKFNKTLLATVNLTGSGSSQNETIDERNITLAQDMTTFDMILVEFSYREENLFYATVCDQHWFTSDTFYDSDSVRATCVNKAGCTEYNFYCYPNSETDIDIYGQWIDEEGSATITIYGIKC